MARLWAISFELALLLRESIWAFTSEINSRYSALDFEKPFNSNESTAKPSWNAVLPDHTPLESNSHLLVSVLGTSKQSR